MPDPPSPDAVIMFIATNMKLARLQRGMTQWQLAIAAKVDLSYVQRLERGRQNVTVRTLARVAAAIGIPVSELLEPVSISLTAQRGRPRKNRGP